MIYTYKINKTASFDILKSSIWFYYTFEMCGWYWGLDPEPLTERHTCPYPFLRHGFAKLLKCPSWAKTCESPALASQSARIICMCSHIQAQFTFSIPLSTTHRFFQMLVWTVWAFILKCPISLVIKIPSGPNVNTVVFWFPAQFLAKVISKCSTTLNPNSTYCICH